MFSHGWPLSADAWEDQMIFLAARGYRCIAHDRRDHGRSGQTWDGNNLDTYADDMADLVAALCLRDVIHVGHSTGAAKSLATSDATALLSSKIVKGATLKIYPGAPHGMCSTLKDKVNAELLAFIGQGKMATA